MTIKPVKQTVSEHRALLTLLPATLNTQAVSTMTHFLCNIFAFLLRQDRGPHHYGTEEKQEQKEEKKEERDRELKMMRGVLHSLQASIW